MGRNFASRTKRSRTGRPRLPVECVRRNRVVTMVTDHEFQELMDRAESEGTSISSLVHDIVKQFISKKRTKQKG